MKASRSQGIWAARHAEWLARVRMFTRRSVQVLRGPHSKSLQEVLTRGCHNVLALAITTNGGVSEMQPNDPIYQTHNNDPRAHSET